MEKNCVLNQSPSLFDAPGTEALALRNRHRLFEETRMTHSLQTGNYRIIKNQCFWANCFWHLKQFGNAQPPQAKVRITIAGLSQITHQYHVSNQGVKYRTQEWKRTTSNPSGLMPN